MNKTLFEEIKLKIFLAKEYFQGGKNALERGDYRIAVDAGYNAIELLMKAGILYKEKDIPKRHGSIAQFFSLIYLKEEGGLRELGKKIGRALMLRNKARYDPKAEIGENEARKVLETFKELLDFLEEEIKKV